MSEELDSDIRYSQVALTKVSFYEEKSYNVTRPYMLEYSFYMGGFNE